MPVVVGLDQVRHGPWLGTISRDSIACAGIRLNSSGKLHNQGNFPSALQLYLQLQKMEKLEGNAPHAWAPKAPKRSSFDATSTGASKLARRARGNK